ncbi:hypothetical protein MKW98_011128 [Papaver atlanticum]|uniref:Leucine-rich repeat-containing N-terminal plant-type domain-containing protein n=1 Tax=Papaver atlanticum TaxID=357466 RepID=A0AAD4TIN4_9MAGN|nr:hypothetical protein MKW98_011128 [Papaver atlanticum]
MKSRPAVFIFVFIYGFFLSKQNIMNFNLVSAVCSDREIEALLNFKQDLVDSSDFLSDWIGKDCCKWNGVICNTKTENTSVVQLNLRGFRLDGMLNSSLVELENLNYLDLSSNIFTETLVPSFLGSLRNLRYLNLSRDFRVENIEWLSNLSSLQYLDMSFIDLSNASSNWLHIVNKIPSLLELHLPSCSLNSNIPSISYLNLTSLKVLDLSNSGFNSTLPEWFYNLTSLEKLDIHYNSFRGTISEAIGNLVNLTNLDLSTNDFEGEIRETLGNLCNLRALDLSENYFKGEIYFLANLSSCTESSLMSINLQDNQFSGPLPDQLGSFKNLDFGRLWKLRILRLAFNALEGIISEAHFANLTSQQELELHSLVFKLKPDWTPPFQLQVPNLQACQLGPQFPKWLQTQKNISRIDISNAGISDTVVPTWFWNMTTQFSFLNLSYNQIHGQVPDLLFPDEPMSPGVLELDLSDNLFNGSISVLLCNPLRKMNTRILDLSGNQLSGEIPDCWSEWGNLQSASLAGNYFTGEIPASIGSINTLRSLHLRNNYLSGELPSALLKCTDLRVIDISENEFTGNIPKWIGEYLSLLILRLRFNKFYGVIPQQLCHLDSVQILDFAHNNLSGTIPRCFNNFTAMTTLQKDGDSISYSVYFAGPKEIASLVTKGREFEYSNTLTLLTIMDISDNSLSGDIPDELTNLIGLRILESLDLSKNELSGSIPQSIVNLTFLSHLNLSYNNLSGQIPVGTQLQGLPESSFIGNGRLCGLPLNDCNGGFNVEEKQGSVDNETEEWFEMKWFYVSLALGFVMGCWGFCDVLIANRSWRLAYFKFLDAITVKLCNCCSSSKPDNQHQKLNECKP